MQLVDGGIDCEWRCCLQVGVKELARFSDAYATILKVSTLVIEYTID